MYCSGTHTVSDNDFEADWTVHYFGPPRTVFGEAKERISLKVTSRLENGQIRAVLRRPDRSGLELQYRLTRRMGLPAV